MESTVFTNIGDNKVNEDYAEGMNCGSFFVYALADGLGGHGDGDAASQAAVKAVLETASQADRMSPGLLERCFRAAQERVISEQASRGRRSSMKTTLTVLLTDKRTAMWGHIGDSRLYRCRNGKVRNRTLDHSVPQMLLNSGRIKESELRHHEDRAMLLQALGDPELNNIRSGMDCLGRTVTPKDVFVLCSDGLWEWLEDDRIAAFACSEEPLEAIAKKMFSEARAAAADARMDNCTVMIVRTCAYSESLKETGLIERVLRRVTAVKKSGFVGLSKTNKKETT